MGKQKVLVIWLKDTAVKIDGTIYKREKIGTFWDGFSWINVTKEGNIKFLNGKKPIALIQQIIKMIPDSNNIVVLDFFSGSSSTAHAVLQQNLEDGGHRKYIMVQLPEKIIADTKENTEYLKYLEDEKIEPIITEIGKERIRRAGEKIRAEKGFIADNLDIGFKVLKLDTSNLRKWQPDYENLEQSFVDYVDNFMPDRTELDVVYEIMLKYGLDLTYPVDEHIISGKKVYSIGFGMLIICLDNEITTETANGILALIKELSPESTRVVLKDNGLFNDSNKTNIKEILKCGGVEEFITI